MAVMDLFHVLRSRSSCREPFDPRRPVTEAELGALLEALRWAPTAHNMQNYEVVAVDDEALLAELAMLRPAVTADFLRESYAQMASSEEELQARRRGVLAAHFPSAWRDPASWEGSRAVPVEGRTIGETLAGAPLVLVVLFDVTARAPGSPGDLLGLISLGCVLQNVWLAAEALGLSFQVVSALGAPDIEPEVKRLLGVPTHLHVAYGARIGHPLGSPVPTLRVRRESDELVHYNGFPRR